MAERAMAAPADARRPAPLVTVLVDYPTLTGRVCELAATGTVVAPGDILELLTRDDTLIQRAVFDSPNTITDISRARTFRGTLRRILDLTHRRCRHDTCHTPAHLCQADHVIPWTQGGPTSTDNGRLTCGPHNRWYYTHEQSRPRAASPPASSSDRDEKAADTADTGGPLRPEQPERPPSITAAPVPRSPGSQPAVSLPSGARWVLRLAARRGPDVVVDAGPRACAVELRPPRDRPQGAWHEYPGPPLRRAA